MAWHVCPRRESRPRSSTKCLCPSHDGILTSQVSQTPRCFLQSNSCKNVCLCFVSPEGSHFPDCACLFLIYSSHSFLCILYPSFISPTHTCQAFLSRGVGEYNVSSVTAGYGTKEVDLWLCLSLSSTSDFSIAQQTPV